MLLVGRPTDIAGLFKPVLNLARIFLSHDVKYVATLDLISLTLVSAPVDTCCTFLPSL